MHFCDRKYKKRETKAGASDIARIYSILATRLSVCRTIGVSLEETKTWKWLKHTNCIKEDVPAKLLQV
ncbi:hypothetical protein DPMN_021183 [Dreissena polymorpha]|uniref:Uncharacterized protein n=1 Tax=Dreissena polymorpha TaxID=45954 RepID=A0A9D4S8Y2_DREPO|nr:hypothetical protein DPMN_021183 [Dreissena polymorpha]